MVTFTSTFDGTNSTSITLPFSSYAFKGTSFKTFLPISWLDKLLTSTSALTAATFLICFSAPLITTESSSTPILSIISLEFNLSLLRTSILIVVANETLL